jgi:hypothetical protein
MDVSVYGVSGIATLIEGESKTAKQGAFRISDPAGACGLPVRVHVAAISEIENVLGHDSAP